MSNFSDLFSGGGGAILGPKLSTPFFQSATGAAPRAGGLEIRGRGAGGGGELR